MRPSRGIGSVADYSHTNGEAAADTHSNPQTHSDTDADAHGNPHRSQHH